MHRDFAKVDHTLIALLVMASILTSCRMPAPRSPGTDTFLNPCKGIAETPLAQKFDANGAPIRHCVRYPETAAPRLIALQLLVVASSTGGWDDAIGVYDIGADKAPLGSPLLLSSVQPGTRLTVSEIGDAGNKMVADPLSLTLSRRGSGVDVSLGNTYDPGVIATRDSALIYRRARRARSDEVMFGGDRFHLVEQHWPTLPDRLLVFAHRPPPLEPYAPDIVGIGPPPDAGGDIDRPLAAPIIDAESARAEAVIAGKSRRFARGADGHWTLATK